MKRKRLLQTAHCPALQTDGRRIMAVSQLVIIDDKVILNIDLFHSSQLRARYFADRNENQYAAYVNGAWSDACLANVVRMAESGQIDYGVRSEMVELSPKEVQKTLEEMVGRQ